MKKWFYERNDKFLNSDLNKTFEQVLAMSENEFRQWCIDTRKYIVYLWDNEGVPPTVGFTENEIVENFNKIAYFPSHTLEQKDYDTNENNVLRQTFSLTSSINQWFPTMMKTKISYSLKGNAYSIYDYFALDEKLETFILYSKRHFKRDSFYAYSRMLFLNDIIEINNKAHKVKNIQEFIDFFENNYDEKTEYDYWFSPIQEETYTGHSAEKLKDKNKLIIDIADIEKLKTRNITKNNVDSKLSLKYTIRYYKKGQKLFPLGFKAFRISYCQPAVNFPVLIAKYLYEKYISHIKQNETINIYDPSAGWAGRLIGALSVNEKYHIHYIGTDPNLDHNTENNRTKYHEIADFFNKNVKENGKLFYHNQTYEIFQNGSETIGQNVNFQKYKGKLDLVFTSPPYFSKEIYSNDKEQSSLKFTQYKDWRDNFLYPTLKTATEYLKNDRYLLWNIADVKYGNVFLPLEEDSRKIIESFGLKYVDTIKMLLQPMPGSNRVKEGVSQYKNSCRILQNGIPTIFKYEPIFVFYKP